MTPGYFLASRKLSSNGFKGQIGKRKPASVQNRQEKLLQANKRRQCGVEGRTNPPLSPACITDVPGRHYLQRSAV